MVGLDLLPVRIMLEERGLEVDVDYQEACVTDTFVVGSDPPVGAPVRPGDDVTVSAFYPTQGFCATFIDRGWELLRFALGVVPAPRFADEVTLYAGDSPPLTLTGDRLKIPRSGRCATGTSAPRRCRC